MRIVQIEPDLPRMAPGLPSTSTEALQAFLAAGVMQAIVDDDEESDAFFVSDWGDLILQMVGFSPEQALGARVAYLRGTISPSCARTYHRPRGRRFDRGNEPVDWDAWGKMG